jgi:hypothetical protein
MCQGHLTAGLTVMEQNKGLKVTQENIVKDISA